MRLALITATPGSVALGSGTHVAHQGLRRELERLGHTVTVVRPAVLRPSVYGFRRWWFNLRLSPHRLPPTDLVVGFDMDGFRIAGKAGAPFVAYLHGVIADEATFERGAIRLALLAQARAERVAARRARLVVTTSQYSRQRLHALYGVPGSRIAIAPPGLDLGRWRAALAGVGPGPFPPDRDPTVLCVARMYPRKNIAALLRAIGLLRTDMPEVRLRVVGDGPERGRLERLARELDLGSAVHFTGHLPFQALAREYAGARVFCLPSLQEGFGMVFVEAMAAGLPVVGCRASSTPELVEDGVNGYLVSPGDDRALAAALHRLLTDAALCGRMRRANLIRAAGHDVSIASQEFVAVIEPVAPTAPAPPVPAGADPPIGVEARAPDP